MSGEDRIDRTGEAEKIAVAEQEAPPGKREQGSQEVGRVETGKELATAEAEAGRLDEQIAETEAFAKKEGETDQEAGGELPEIQKEAADARARLDALNGRKAALDAELGNAPPAPEAEVPAGAAAPTKELPEKPEVEPHALDHDAPDDDEDGNAQKKNDEKEGDDAGKKREQMEAMTREMKERARQAFETTVSPALKKIRDMAEQFSDLPDDVREIVADEMKQGERFFTMDDYRPSLSAREVGNLEKLLGNLRSARNGKEFARIYTNESLADIHDFAFPNMWPNIARENWNMLAQRGLNELAGEKKKVG